MHTLTMRSFGMRDIEVASIAKNEIKGHGRGNNKVRFAEHVNILKLLPHQTITNASIACFLL
jgi:hypothetical protein